MIHSSILKQIHLGKHRKQAFTLIELLVVIAIIAILAAILFPVFAQAKESAKKANCISNAKNISIAGLLYISDYEDTWPYLVVTSGGYPVYTMNSWFGGGTIDYSTFPQATTTGFSLFHPYLKNGPINECPSAVDLPSYAGGSSITTVYKIAYSANAFFSYEPLEHSVFDNLTETIMFGDSADFHYSTFPGKPPTKAAMHCSNTSGLALSPGNCVSHGRHLGKTTIAWMDGHVKVHSLVYATQSFPPYYVASDMKRANLGAVLKFPPADPVSFGMPIDGYYLYYDKSWADW